MQAGQLRHRVTIQQLVAGSPQQTSSGAPDESWADLLTNVSAKWITLRGNELYAAQQHSPDIRGIWRMRWRDSVTNQMRVVHKGLYYNILFVPPYDRNGKKEELDLECTQGMNLG